MAEKKELNPSPKFPSGDYPELSPNPNQREGLVNKTGEKPNTQIVNLPKEQEKRCLTVSEVVELIKKIAPQYGAENVKFTVTNIKSLTDAQCEDLKVGDMVAKKTGNQNHVYVVTYKEKNQGLCLTYADASVVETQSYDYTNNHWVYNSEDKTDFSSIRLPDATAVDKGKVLEVISGAWGKGNKKVNVIDASEIPNPLTEEFILTKLNEGLFVNGIIGNYKNPVLFPLKSTEEELNTFGVFIATHKDYNYSIIGTYRVQGNTNLVIPYRENLKLSPFGTSIENKNSPQVEVALTNLGTITSTETASGSNFYKNEIPYTGGINNEDVINVKMSNGAVYQAINDTTNSKLVIYTGVDFASNSISVSKCWKLGY